LTLACGVITLHDVVRKIRPNVFTFELPPELRAGLEEMRERHGTPVAVSVRRAIQVWLKENRVTTATKGQRTKTNR
jgi:hypothetical protein